MAVVAVRRIPFGWLLAINLVVFGAAFGGSWLASSLQSGSHRLPEHLALVFSFWEVPLMLLGVAWAAQADGVRALGWKGGEERSAAASRRVLIAAGILLAGFLALGALYQIPIVDRLDNRATHQVFRWAYRHGPKALKSLMSGVSKAGGKDMLTLWGPVIALVLLAAGRARSIRFYAASMFGAFGVEGIPKVLFHRLRPQVGGHPRMNFDSFPSGHALSAAILAGTLLVILLPGCRKTWQRALLYAGAVAWPLLICCSRVYLGAHHPMDILAGVLIGAAWVALCEGLLLRWSGRPAATPSTVPEAVPVAAK